MQAIHPNWFVSVDGDALELAQHPELKRCLVANVNGALHMLAGNVK